MNDVVLQVDVVVAGVVVVELALDVDIDVDGDADDFEVLAAISDSIGVVNNALRLLMMLYCRWR